MTIAILATIAIVLFVLLLFQFTVRILKNESNKDWTRMLELLLEERRAEVEYLQQWLDWTLSKEEVCRKKEIADGILFALQRTNYTTWKYNKKI